MFDHFVMGMASAPPHHSPSPISPHTTTTTSYFAPPPLIPAPASTPTDSLVAALESESLTHLDDISPSALPHDDDAEHMYLTVDDSEPEHSKAHPHTQPPQHHARRRPRPLNKQLLSSESSSGPHPKALSSLVSDMISTGSQCTVSAAPLPSASSLAEFERQISTEPEIPLPTPYQITTTTIPPILADPYPVPLPDLDLDFDLDDEDEGFSELSGAARPLGTIDANPPVLAACVSGGDYARASDAFGTRRWSHLRMRRMLMEGGMGAEMAEMEREMLGGVGEGQAVMPRVRKAISRRRTEGRVRRVRRE